MKKHGEAFVGIDVAKLRNAVAVADAGRDGEVRFYGEVDASPESMRRLAAKLAGKHQRLHFCYEAGPTGYGLHRLLTGLGHSCVVVAPSLVPRKPSDRIKTNRRDALTLARLPRAGELTCYTTLEPCLMCAGALLQAHVSRLVFGAWDAKAGAAGSLWDVVRDRRLNHRPEVTAGVRAEESAALLRAFFRGQRGL